MIHKYKILVVLVWLTISQLAVAQNDEQVIISPDRPGMGTGPGVMPHKYF